MITNEFRTLKGECSFLIPRGPGYENITLANQVCTAVGSVPGQSFVDGMAKVRCLVSKSCTPPLIRNK